MSGLFDISGKTVLITGASSGIGLHLAKTFASHGARVIACSRTAENSRALSDLAAQAGNEILPLSVDVSDPKSIEAGFNFVRERFGRLDVLVNNAGTANPKRIEDTSAEDWDATMQTNLRGPFLMSRAALPIMSDGGSLIHVASIGAFKAIVGLSSYSASKSGLLLLSRTIAVEAAHRGIRSNVVAPGYVVTPLNEDFLGSAQGERIRSNISLRRFAKPEDLDGAMVFLASDASSYMTGGCILVDGGFLL